jgi:hypothetical protein
MELVGEVKELLRETAKELKGSARRLFMARTVRALGEGGQRLAERELGWNRGTLRKGQHELSHGVVCLNACSWRGRKRSEEHLPHVLSDITAIVEWAESSRPAVSHQSSVHTPDSNGSTTPVDGEVWLQR